MVLSLGGAAVAVHASWCNDAPLEASLAFGLPMLAATAFLGYESSRPWQGHDPLEYRTWNRNNATDARDEESGGQMCEDEEMVTENNDEENGTRARKRQDDRSWLSTLSICVD